MESRTKRRLSPGQLDALLRRAMGTGVADASELTDGFANAVWRVRLDDGREVVLKLSPPPDLDQLTYERNLLRMEAHAIELAGAAGVPVAGLLRAGFDDPVLGGDYLVLRALDGTPWNRTRPDSPDDVRRELGRHLATLASVTGEVFGYPHNGITGPTWRAAYLAMLGALLDDTRRYPTPLPLPAEEIRRVAESAAHVLQEVRTPSLVHFDVWPGNVFLTLDGRIQAIIDHERAFWGDPLAELITPTIFGEVAENDPLLAGYREVRPLELTPAALARLDLYRTYLYLILLVENGPRQYPEEEYAPLRDLATTSLVKAVEALR
ncbi:phosphotransferase family protein [Nonomuraea sp. NPDC050547]|uniref:phosphotransferase family protein n=1 Tax=Nonomuraea sp. NPDC050547 TaxID=3364368 RepID=UPI00378B2E58